MERFSDKRLNRARAYFRAAQYLSEQIGDVGLNCEKVVVCGWDALKVMDENAQYCQEAATRLKRVLFRGADKNYVGICVQKYRGDMG